MELRVGYPDRWRDYSGLDIDRGPYVLNVMRANEFEQRARSSPRSASRVDRSEWYMTPQTVNAYYDPSMNSLNVPAGILQPPYFDVSWPDAVNYGATGAHRRSRDDSRIRRRRREIRRPWQSQGLVGARGPDEDSARRRAASPISTRASPWAAACTCKAIW